MSGMGFNHNARAAGSKQAEIYQDLKTAKAADLMGTATMAMKHGGQGTFHGDNSALAVVADQEGGGLIFGAQDSHAPYIRVHYDESGRRAALEVGEVQRSGTRLYEGDAIEGVVDALLQAASSKPSKGKGVFMAALASKMKIHPESGGSYGVNVHTAYRETHDLRNRDVAQEVAIKFLKRIEGKGLLPSPPALVAA